MAISSSTVKSAERTLDVLGFLASQLRPTPTLVIAQQCQIPKSSVYPLLKVMHGRGWVTYYEQDHAWGLGAAAFETGSAYLRSAPLQRLGRPLLRRLSTRTLATSHLATLHGEEVLYIDKAEAPAAHVRLVTEIGVRLPAHLTAVGRAILALLPMPQLEALYARPVLTRRTGLGPLTIGSLKRELAPVRANGFAYEVGLTTHGIACLAAAVQSDDGYPIAAIGITFISGQHSDGALAELARDVRGATDRLSQLMGPRRQIPDGLSVAL